MSPTEPALIAAGRRPGGQSHATSAWPSAARRCWPPSRLDIAPGSVVALLGANGAGKSTLIKILSGVHTDHGGEVRVAGEPAALHSPLAARQLGIQTVHQRIGEGIVPGLTVAENLVFEELAQRRGNPFLNGAPAARPRPGDPGGPRPRLERRPARAAMSPNSASPTASC